jgi:hypothetical protein
MRTVPKPWGHEFIWAETPAYVGKILFIKKGEQLSLQYHEVKDETVMVLSGLLRFEYFEEGQTPQVTELAPRVPFHVYPRLRHRMIALQDSEVVEVSTPQLLDVVRLSDRYGRSGTSTP